MTSSEDYRDTKKTVYPLTLWVGFYLDESKNKYVLSACLIRGVQPNLKTVGLSENTFEGVMKMHDIIVNHGGYWVNVNANAYSNESTATLANFWELYGIMSGSYVDEEQVLEKDPYTRQPISRTDTWMQTYYVIRDLYEKSDKHPQTVNWVVDCDKIKNGSQTVFNKTFPIRMVLFFGCFDRNKITRVDFSKWPSFKLDANGKRSGIAILTEFVERFKLPMASFENMKQVVGNEFMSLGRIGDEQIAMLNESNDTLHLKNKEIDQWTYYERSWFAVKFNWIIGKELDPTKAIYRQEQIANAKYTDERYPALGSDFVEAKSIAEQITHKQAILDELREESAKLTQQLSDISDQMKKIEEQIAKLTEQQQKEEEEKQRMEAEKKRKEEVENKLMDEAKQQFLENGTISFIVLKQLTHEKKEELMAWCEQNSSDEKTDTKNDA